MRHLLEASVLIVALAGAAAAEVTFAPVDVYVDSGEAALGAYQVEVSYDNERVKIAGLEGGQTRAFNAAPFYDPKGLETGRIVVAAFIPEGLDEKDAPSGRTRVARLHLQIDTDDAGEALGQMTIRIVVTANAAGERVGAKAELSRHAGPERGEADDE